MENGWIKIFAIGFAVLAIGCSSRLPGTRDEVRASSFGFDASDSTRFLQAAFDSGAKKVVVDRQSGDWVADPLFVTNSNVEIVLEDGVTIRARAGQFHGRNDCLIDIGRNASNIVLRGEGRATLRMNKSDYQDPSRYSWSEWRMCVNITHARNVTVRNLRIESSGGDGVYVGGNARDVLLENLICRNHHRQGISVTDASGLTVRKCEFRATAGTPPACGVDIEPNRESNQATDILFEDCTFNDNAAHGIDLHLGQFNARTKPISVVFRRCVSKGNRSCGISIFGGDPNVILKTGPVRGTILFADCRIEGNRQEAVKIMNHCANGLDIRFENCTFDVCGTGAESAFAFSNARLLKDFGGIACLQCRLLMDQSRKACLFEAQDGIGIAGAFKGRLEVSKCAGTSPSLYDLADFAAQHVPHPERVSSFRSVAIDFKKLSIPPQKLLKGVWTPNLRRSFGFVQAVPSAGTYEIRFRARHLRKGLGDKPCATVQVFDRMGTDLGSFSVPEGESTHEIKASGENVYRFDVKQGNGSVMALSSKTPGFAVLFDRKVNLFGCRDKRFFFAVPAGAKEVQIDLAPEEPASARLFDAQGLLVAEMPFQTRIHRMKVSCSPKQDEIWTLEIPKADEDFSFQIGGDVIPLLSMEKDGVVR